MNLEQSNQVIDLLGFLRRRGKFVAIVAGGISLLTFWIAMALPNLYTSSAMILVFGCCAFHCPHVEATTATCPKV